MAELITRYVRIAVGFVVVWILLYFYNGYGCRQVPGVEMEPTVKKEQWLIVQPTLYKPEAHIGYDDVIAFEYEHPGEGRSVFASRVVGLPGDRIRVEKGDVFRDGSKVDQAYVGQKSGSSDSYEEVVVPRNSFFVLGDNRQQSAKYDSRGIGPIGQYAVLGKLKY